jgi:hypothetical protein
VELQKNEVDLNPITYLVDPDQESLPSLLPLCHGRKVSVFVDQLLGCSDAMTIPASNTAGKLVNKVVELTVWDCAIDP